MIDGSLTVENTRKVLYVEDNPDNRLLVRRILMADDFEVLEAASAKEALLVLEANKPNLILMDINMPKVDGNTLTAYIKSLPRMKNVPIIALTANVMKGDRERSLSAGCDGYIQKPIDVDSLPELVHQFISASTHNQ
jgi:two-component system cell cycle response regulator DivK